jgi:hypothetical protein
MQVTFMRTDKRRYAVHVTREHAVDLVMDPAPGFHEYIPHDLVHFLVETHFGLRNGVYGLLAVGGDADTFLDPAGSVRERKRMKAKNRLSGADVGRSEKLAGLVQHAWELRYGGSQRPLPEDGLDALGVAAQEIDDAVEALHRLAHSWHALSVGNRLRLTWPWPERKVGRAS